MRPWHDPILESYGHDPRSAYVERFWIAILGPSVVWLLRLLAREFDELGAGEELELDLEPTARRLGLRHRGGRASTFTRTFLRCEQFGLARFESDGALAVRRRLPSVPRKLHDRMPARLRSEVTAWGCTHCDGDAAGGAAASNGLCTGHGPATHAVLATVQPLAPPPSAAGFSTPETRLLATCMLMLGHGLHETAERLVMLGLKPQAANAATAWAWAERHCRPLARLPL